MHGRSQNVDYERSYISDEEFHDAEENDLSDLESIPSPSLFQTHNLSGSTSSDQSTINYYGNIYQGGVKGNKLSGFGKLSSKNKKEYIGGIWHNSQLIEVFSCQFIYLICSMHSRNEMRIYGKDNLFIFDRGNFVAKIKFGELKELDFARPLNPLNSGRGFLEKITITKVC
ncbi:hypothetical protein TNIN_464291 [Trichonephila inaurata madagascariensis]|uniref:Uncharacterized protein n=1 Tax=Trichonephila inaurata madagascariensis TaxID=2747483 RepID=A0A8X6MDI6_9ARAC|nr:hypothetical protein TNIN_464291 [Trichonephila inaurata madagascariensis]